MYAWNTYLVEKQMTKSQIVAEITKRVGDPNSTGYGTDSWNYFIEALYQLFPTLNDNEKRYLTRTLRINTDTDSSGYVSFTPANWEQWNDVYGVNVNGIPARSIDRDEFYKMKTNDLYSPAETEFYYIFEGQYIRIITGLNSETVNMEIYYLLDAQSLLENAVGTDSILLNNSVIYRAIPLATARLKEQIGLSL